MKPGVKSGVLTVSVFVTMFVVTLLWLQTQDEQVVIVSSPSGDSQSLVFSLDSAGNITHNGKVVTESEAKELMLAHKVTSNTVWVQTQSNTSTTDLLPLLDLIQEQGLVVSFETEDP